jgi:hypothetical protein
LQKRLLYFLLALISFFAVYLRLHTLGEPLEGDITTYAYVSHRLLEGASLYTDVFDHKPPAIFWAYAAGEIFLGYEPLAIFALGAVFTLISIVFLFLFLKTIASEATALIGAGIWVVASNAHLLEANQPNAELFLNAFLFISLWAYALHRTRGGSVLPVVSGASFALATLFKMIAVFPLLAFIAYSVIRPTAQGMAKFKEAGLVLLPVVFGWLAVFTYYIAVGRFGDFWEAVFIFNMDYAGGGVARNLFKYLSSPGYIFHFAQAEVLALFILAGLWVALGRREYNGLSRLFFGFLAFSLIIEVSSPGQFWGHYYQLYLPALVIFSALFFHEMLDLVRPPKRVLAGVVFASALVLVTASLARPQIKYLGMSTDEISLYKYQRSTFVDAREAGEYIKGITCPDDFIYEAGSETGVYYYSKRRATAPVFILSHIYVGPEEKGLRRAEGVIKALKDEPPAVFIWDAWRGVIENTAFHEVVEGKYARVRDFGMFNVYALKGKTAVDAKLECGGT